MKQIGVKACLSTAAVGSLRRDWPVGTLVACSDFPGFHGQVFDYVRSPVIHRDFSTPFGVESRQRS